MSGKQRTTINKVTRPDNLIPPDVIWEDGGEYTKADEVYAARLYDDALARYRSLLSEDPTGWAHYRCFTILERAGIEETAVDHFYSAFPLLCESFYQGNPRAIFALGRMCEVGQAGPVDLSEAERLYAIAAEKGNLSASYNLALMKAGPMCTSYTELVRLYSAAADRGHAGAQNNLAGFYKTGTGVRRNFSEAFRLYSLAADQGHAMALTNLGNMYRHGQGIEKKPLEALRLYQESVSQGYPRAYYYIALLFQTGEGVKIDYSEAMRLYTRAAQAGHSNSMTKLASLYLSGPGGEKNEAEALLWLTRAAKAGSEKAIRNLRALLVCEPLMACGYEY